MLRFGTEERNVVEPSIPRGPRNATRPLHIPMTLGTRHCDEGI
jgi:hypothetical protein